MPKSHKILWTEIGTWCKKTSRKFSWGRCAPSTSRQWAFLIQRSRHSQTRKWSRNCKNKWRMPWWWPDQSTNTSHIKLKVTIQHLQSLRFRSTLQRQVITQPTVITTTHLNRLKARLSESWWTWVSTTFSRLMPIHEKLNPKTQCGSQLQFSVVRWPSKCVSLKSFSLQLLSNCSDSEKPRLSKTTLTLLSLSRWEKTTSLSS